jgi:hypothetical protein
MPLAAVPLLRRRGSCCGCHELVLDVIVDGSKYDVSCPWFANDQRQQENAKEQRIYVLSFLSCLCFGMLLCAAL